MADEKLEQISLPKQVLAEAEKAAAKQGTSLDDFMTSAVNDRIAKAKADEFFAERRGRVDWEAFEQFMNRPTDAPLIPGDELPEGYVHQKFGQSGD
jgi:uncharacterized protein (DUF1778 family)